MSVKDRMVAILTANLHPQMLAVEDESHRHAGHGGWREGGETHFRVTVVSEVFNGRSRLDRHRLVNALLAAELRDGVHALAIEARGTGEDAGSAAGARP